MTLDKTRLKTNMKAKIHLYFEPDFPILSEEYIERLCHAVSDAVVEEITANAVVTSTTTTPNAQAGSTTLPGTATGTVT